MIRILKITLITLLLCLVVIPLFGCSSKVTEDTASESSVVTVKPGDLTVDITAAGNLALSRTEELAFDLFYTDGTVAEVLVEEGDNVQEGEVLASVDTSEWQDQLKILESKVVTVERSLTQSEIDVENAEIAWYETAVFQYPDISDAQAEVDRARYAAQYATKRLLEAPDAAEATRWARLAEKAEADVATAEDKLNLLLSSTLTDDRIIKKKQLELAQKKLEDAKQAVDDAQENLDKAKSKSPLITAPFDGFITLANVEGGDEIKTGTVAVVIADPNKFEAEIMVSEMDIMQVKEGTEARVQVTAIPGLYLPAKVTHISPTATIQSGVVNYKVKVEVQPFTSTVPLQTLGTSDNATTRTPAGARDAARLSEQAQNVQLREGLNVTVSIIVAERNSVLLVPNTAITRQGMKNQVKVSKDGVTEAREIQTGLSDWQYTEVTDGLSEGEQIIVPAGASTTSTTSQQQRTGGVFIPGMGGPPR